MTSLRQSRLDALERDTFDVLVRRGHQRRRDRGLPLGARGSRSRSSIGATSRGFTSQQSSNLAWGGIKYMETFELSLVRSSANRAIS
jgi:glycerol-3-phosphate dehydrogenase